MDETWEEKKKRKNQQLFSEVVCVGIIEQKLQSITHYRKR